MPVNEINTVEVEEATKEIWEFDASTPHTSLKRPISSPLRRNT